MPSDVLAQLLAQHKELRALMDRCEAMASPLADDDTMALDLTREVTRLRLALAAHNQLEETVLRPALSAADSFGEVRIDQMVDHHVAEHDTLRGQLDRLRVGDLRVTIASLRRHLELEERTFLSPRVLRDDVVTVEGAG